MATRTDGLPDRLFEQGPILVVGFIVLWAFWAVFFVYEYVGDDIRLSAFLLALVVGMLVGVGFGHWHRRTETGRRADRRYRNAPLGRKAAFVLVTAIAIVGVIYLTVTLGISSLLLEAGLFGATLTNHLVDISVVYSHARAHGSV
jgi:hypothetical protein